MNTGQETDILPTKSRVRRARGKDKQAESKVRETEPWDNFICGTLQNLGLGTWTLIKVWRTSLFTFLKLFARLWELDQNHDF